MRCVRRIAKLIGVECDEETVARVVHNTTHAEMARHSSKFDFHNLVPFWAKMYGDESSSEFNGRVRKDGGRSGDGQKLSREVQERIDQDWYGIITATLGFRDLKEMRATWKKEMDML